MRSFGRSIILLFLPLLLLASAPSWAARKMDLSVLSPDVQADIFRQFPKLSIGEFRQTDLDNLIRYLVTEEQFDLLIVDIFEDEITPPQFCTEEFLETCASLLRPGGLLLFNRLHGEDVSIRQVTERFFERRFKNVFPEAWAIDTKGNWILCAQKQVLQ